MTTEEIISIQQSLGMSDRKLAIALGVTRQTFRNWRTGSNCPALAQNAIKWMLEIKRLDPENDNLPAMLMAKP